MKEARLVTIAPDSFLGTLGLRELEHRLRGAEQRDALFRLTVEFLTTRVSIAGAPTADTAINELPLRIPGTPVVVRLAGPDERELTALLGLACYLLGGGALDAKSMTLAGLMALLSRVRRLRAEYGERSIFDVLGEVEPPTIREITLALYGKPCRYPSVACRYRNPDAKHCMIASIQVEGTVADLVDRGILCRLNAVEPYEFGVVL